MKFNRADIRINTNTRNSKADGEGKAYRIITRTSFPCKRETR